MGGYSKGKLSGAYQYVLQDLIKNIEYYDWIYEKLEDDISVKVFTNLIQYRIIPDWTYIKQAFDAENPQYFDKDIICCGKDEVFVDCGGYIGDTTETYIEQYKEYKKIYVYEPSSDNIAACRKNLEKYERIKIRNCGVGERNTIMSISNSGSSSSFMGESEGESKIEIVSLDEDINEKITFIKMDIEGFEIPAIIGAKNHIKNECPKLAICTYHIISDMWEIPKLLYYISPNYKFYFRHYMETKNWETVLYAIPNETGMERDNKVTIDIKQKRVVALSFCSEGLSGMGMIDDVTVIPYLLYKNHGCDVVIVEAKGEYYRTKTCVEGIKMEFLENGSEEEKLHYIEEHVDRIDCLLLRGCCSSNFRVSQRYKQLNPSGRLYIELDTNSAWVDRNLWDMEVFDSFMSCCDVIATSSRTLQEYLNRKWPWKIEYVERGYYNFQNEDSIPVIKDKKNVIFTVGRIGDEQKAIHILLEAFAMISDRIPDWQLRLVGSIDKNFEPYLEQFFNLFPQLKERIIFLEHIQERQCLWKEYLEAKIFALPSLYENGIPVVVAEALNAGCVMAVTQIDAYEEMINNGKCGMAVNINDVQDMGQILLKLCMNKDLMAAMSENAYEYGREYFNMERCVARLNEMLFMGK